MSTRSQRPDLHSPLPPVTRPRRQGQHREGSTRSQEPGDQEENSPPGSSHGRGSTNSLQLFGNYPITPIGLRNPSPQQGRQNQRLGEDPRGQLEALRGGSEFGRYRGSENSSVSSPRIPESPPGINSTQ